MKRAHTEILRATEQAVDDVSGVGVLLSGGIDSSVILAALKENGVSETLALTLAFKDHESEYEIQWAERVAKALNSPQRTGCEGRGHSRTDVAIDAPNGRALRVGDRE